MTVDKTLEPGFHELTNEEYHSFKNVLSSSGARSLLNVCPARFRYDADHPQEPNRNFDIGNIAHRLILGLGSMVEIVDAKDWRKKEPKEIRDAAYAAGKIPVLKSEFDACQEMAQAIVDHPFAGGLFKEGSPEQSIFWQDEEFGFMCRARPDWLPTAGKIFADYKTTTSAAPIDVNKSVDNFSYYQQAAWYADGIRAVGHIDEPIPVFVFQEKKAPYLVTVAQLDPIALEWGNILNRKARSIFAQCLERGEWPGYADDVITAELPYYTESKLQRRHEAGEFETALEMQAPLEQAL
mgnify:CR=1 FL=1|tara:strand:- start:5419 stop:6303 length:885 start_codon:yes stop_codon:yes gene_type:complete